MSRRTCDEDECPSRVARYQTQDWRASPPALAHCASEFVYREDEQYQLEYDWYGAKSNSAMHHMAGIDDSQKDECRESGKSRLLDSWLTCIKVEMEYIYAYLHCD